MAAWLPVTATVLAFTGVATGWSALTGGDCSSCTAPASSPPAVTTTVETVAAEAGPTLGTQEVYVLKFHADWCPKCKKLNPVYDAMTKRFDEKPVAFVKLDVTNKNTTKQSEEKMKELGLTEVWDANKGKNGFLLLVDAETKKSVKTLNHKTTEDEAAEAIEDALDG